jgi:hypothetical protein
LDDVYTDGKQARNGVRNGDKMKNPKSLAEQIKVYVDMINLHLRKLVSNNRCELKLVKWTLPPEGTVCLNVHVAMFKSSNQIGVES